ncbi:aldo/keto reductase [Bordetella genomosp. 13]|uniref:Aldo/keto reductase n=2 Tax=Bordetella genomosp. 13 TaxID=463040 RepID=A0A1W6ZAU4_9BORD|nr:aldo/keto reductase [Bordetella genomosp. 13]
MLTQPEFISHRDGRRDFLRAGVSAAALTGAGLLPLAGLAQRAPATTVAAASAPPVLTRRIPSTGEVLPAIGLGTFLTFDVLPGQPRQHLREVMQRFWEAGGRVLDTSPLYGTGEISVGDHAASLGIAEGLFMANKIWSTGEFLADESHASRSLAQSQNRLWRERMDLMQVHSLTNIEFVLPYLKAWKKEGRIRYTGITHYEDAYLPLLAAWIERGQPDFVQVQYSIASRRAEERVLPLAAERGVAVLTNLPFEKARLFALVEGRPVPDFVKEIGVQTWAQYFLKWVISNPVVTCALPSTSNPAHMAENMEALRGPLPDAAMRARMLKHMEGIPGFDKVTQMPWYPGKRYQGLIARNQAALRART